MMGPSRGSMARRTAALPLARFAASVAVAGLAAAAAVLGCEVVVRVTGMDARAIARGLYLQMADVEAHRVSADPVLHYELMPGGLGAQNHLFPAHIDRHGARGREHPEPKGEGTVRILVFGGSTVYGARVQDDETIPALLERVLNERATSSGDATVYEAWNFGTSAYVTSQMARLARLKLDLHAPDLMVVVMTNMGRRAFLGTEPLEETALAWLEADPDFVPENLPPPEGMGLGEHRALLRRWALYRYATAWRAPGRHVRGSLHAATLDRACSCALVREAESRGVPVLFVAAPQPHEVGRFRVGDVFDGFPEARFLDLHVHGREPDYYDLHPPLAILEEHARSIADALGERGLLRPGGRGPLDPVGRALAALAACPGGPLPGDGGGGPGKVP